MKVKCSNKQYGVMAKIVEKNNYQNIINIGVYQGGSIFPMAKMCAGKIHCVDAWEINEWKKIFIDELKSRNIKNCVIHHMLSEEFLETTTEIFDFAFIDGCHRAVVVKADILGCIKCGAKDILCHDWKDHKQRPGKKFGVETAINELLKENVIDMIEEVEFMARIKPCNHI